MTTDIEYTAPDVIPNEREGSSATARGFLRRFAAFGLRRLAAFRMSETSHDSDDFAPLLSPLEDKYNTARTPWGRGLFALLAAAALLLSLAAPPAARAQDIKTSLVGHWRLDETSGLTVSDSSGSGLSGSWVGDAAVPAVTGAVGGALDFDSADDYVEISDDAALDLQGAAYTLAAWIYPRSFGENGQGRIMDKNGGVSAGWTFQVDNSFGCQGVNSLVIQLNGSCIESDFGLAPLKANDNIITLNTWQHVAVTMQPATRTITFYVDGVPSGTVTAGVTQSPPTDNALPMRIGIRSSDLNRDFDGFIDDVRIYNRALTVADIAELAAATYPGKMRFNTSVRAAEYHDGTKWVAMGKTLDCGVGYVPYNERCISVVARTATTDTSYHNWDDGEPGAGTSENCLIMWEGDNGLWHDGPCGQHVGYVCQKPLGGGCTDGYVEYGGVCYRLSANTVTGLFSGWRGIGEPNGGTGENCGVMFDFGGADDGKWGDINCNDSYHYMCEKPLGGGCVGGYSENSGRCFKYFNTNATWATARANCIADGGDLAVSNSSAVDAHLKTLYTPATARAWIGLTDSALEGDWRHVDGTRAPSLTTDTFARAICQAEGGDMVIVRDAGTDAFLKGLYDENIDSVWLGATDIVNENDWIWVDGTPLKSLAGNWDGARSACQLDGGDLLKSNDALTDAFIETLYDEATERLWIAGSDTATEGTWIWTDGSAVTYAGWGGGEPNGGVGENCMAKWDGGLNGNWVDAPCTFGGLGYACEKPLSTAVATPCDTIGEVCADGSVYAGLSPDGNEPMYTTPADAGQFNWNDGSTNYVDTAMQNCVSNTPGAEASCQTGEANSALLVGLGTTPSPAPYVAARYCESLDVHGQTDWYLPAQDELDVMYDNRVAIGGFDVSGLFPSGWYWSSSEISFVYAKNQRFSDGFQDSAFNKEVAIAVRCVRKQPTFVTNPPSCSNPSRPMGSIYYNTTSNVLQFCNGEDWVAAGPVPGAGGAGCINPAGVAGDIFFNSTHSALQYCDGGTWRAVGKEPPQCPSAPYTFSTPGSFSYVQPANCGAAIIEVFGAGGGGAPLNRRGGGGGGGGSVVSRNVGGQILAIAGGGGGGGGCEVSDMNGSTGGGGGYAKATVTFAPGEMLDLWVGAGGLRPTAGNPDTGGLGGATIPNNGAQGGNRRAPGNNSPSAGYGGAGGGGAEDIGGNSSSYGGAGGGGDSVSEGGGICGTSVFGTSCAGAINEHGGGGGGFSVTGETVIQGTPGGAAANGGPGNGNFGGSGGNGLIVITPIN